jgi:ATP-dependent helicase/nuclease subunit A
MSNRLGSGDDAEQGTSEEGKEAVTVLTVHKAKGLERERVILAGIQEKQTSGKSGLNVCPDSDGYWAVRINSKEKSPLWENLEEEDAKHNRAERLRLLYVAMTRAKEELVLVQTGGDSRVEGNVWLEALETGWEFRPEGPPPEIRGILFTAPEGKAATIASSSQGTPSAKEALSAINAWADSPPKPVALNASPSSIAHQISSYPPDSGIGGELAAATGTLIHKLFEIWDFHSWESLKKPMAGEGAEIAEKECVPLNRLLTRAADILDRLPGTPLGDLLLTLRQAEKYPELPALHKKDGKSWQGFIDLLYREKGGPWVVADFKTDASLAPEDAVAQYRAQLDLYGETIHAALGEPPELKIFLLDTGVIADIPSQRANQ